MTAADRLDQIEARANAATEGPWRTEFLFGPGNDLLYAIMSGRAKVVGSTLAENDAAAVAAARTDVPALVAALRAVQQIAFDPDIVSALEHGVVRDGPGTGVGISTAEALNYAVEALRDIRNAITEALG